MWYLTILYLYVNINTCCCITNGIKKGWLKCWVSENSACMERVPQGAVVVAEQEHVRDWSWLFQAADGAGAGPGSCGILCCSCWNPGVTAQVTKSPVLLLLPPLSAGSQCWLPVLPPVHCALSASLFAGSVPYRNTWREQKLQPGCFPAAGSVLVGQLSLCVTLLSSCNA